MTVKAYWPLSSVYFFYFAVLGATNPYWGLYLQSLGFGTEDIGALMAVFIATKLVAPNLWSYWADRNNAHIPVMRIGALLTPLSFLAVYLQQGFWTMAAAMVLYSFFWNAILPQYEVITLRAIKGYEERYSQIRLWGSIGFIVAVAGLGWLLDMVDVSYLPVSIFVIMGLMALSSWFIPSPVVLNERLADNGSLRPCVEVDRSDLAAKPNNKHFLCVLATAPVWVFLLAVVLMQVSHGPYYTFFSIFMEEIGYSRTLIGLLWSLGVMAEVIIFAIMHRLLARFKAEDILLVSLVLAALRWGLTGFFSDVLPMLLLLQLLHAASFGSFHAASIALVQRFFKGNHAAQGQAIYSSLGFGIGGALGAWGSGLLWQQAGAEVSYLTASLSAGLGATFIWLSLWRHRQYWRA